MRTGKRWLLLTVLLVTGLAGVAPVRAVDVVGGVDFGYSNADLVGANDGGLSTKSSAIGGVIVGWKINPWFSVRSGLDVSVKGATLEGYSFGDLPTSIGITYVELPVLAKFKYCIPSGSASGPFAVVGPSLALATHATAKYAGEDNNWNQYVKDVDVGLDLGAGYEFPAGPGVVTLEARYVFGFLDVFESSAPRPEVTGDLKNRTLKVMLGWYANMF